MYWAHLSTVNCRPFPFTRTDSPELEPLQRRRISVPKETSRWLIRPWFLMLLVIRYHLHVKNIYILSIIILYYATMSLLRLHGRNHQCCASCDVRPWSFFWKIWDPRPGAPFWSDEGAVSAETTMVR